MLKTTKTITSALFSQRNFSTSQESKSPYSNHLIEWNPQEVSNIINPHDNNRSIRFFTFSILCERAENQSQRDNKQRRGWSPECDRDICEVACDIQHIKKGWDVEWVETWTLAMALMRSDKDKRTPVARQSPYLLIISKPFPYLPAPHHVSHPHNDTTYDFNQAKHSLSFVYICPNVNANDVHPRSRKFFVEFKFVIKASSQTVNMLIGAKVNVHISFESFLR